MKNIMIGNGVNLQFGGKEYSVHSIMKRLTAMPDFTEGKLKGLLNRILKAFNSLPELSMNEAKKLYINQDALQDIKNRYLFPVEEISDIMLEDLFLPLHIVLGKYDMEERGLMKDYFKRLILDCIYYEGKLQKLYLKMPDSFRIFLNEFDNIFTLNYDNNIENLTHKKVYHLHGDFSVLEDKYNINTVIGKANEMSGKLIPVSEEIAYLYCNALLEYCGTNKTMNTILDWEMNRLYDMMLEQYNNQWEFRDEVRGAKKNNPDMYYKILAKVSNPSLDYRSDYHFHKLKEETEGEIHLLGISPNNDEHIFNLICGNEKIHTVIYYYFEKDDIDIINKFFYHKQFGYASVKDLWKALGNE